MNVFACGEDDTFLFDDTSLLVGRQPGSCTAAGFPVVGQFEETFPRRLKPTLILRHLRHD